MVWRRFNLQVIVRIMLIAANLLVFARIFGNENLFFNQLILAALFILQTGELIYFLNHTNRELSRLFLSIRHSDFSYSFREAQLGGSFRELQESLNGIITAYKDVKIEKETQYQFLQKLISQINTGIITTDGNKIELINPYAEQLLDAYRMHTWDSLRNVNPEFTKEVESLGSSGRKLIEIKQGGEQRIISLDVSTIYMMETEKRIITIQDINSEVEQREIEAWHKLIRILTHEIMNSITPVASLTETARGMLTGKNGEPKSSREMSDDVIKDISFALETIHKRSDGLLDFVENYRKLSRIPRPVRQRIYAAEFFGSVEKLLSAQIEQAGAHLETEILPEDLTLEIDRTLMEQVFINLIANSLHALEGMDTKQITIRATAADDRITITVTDTGSGIPSNVINDIFIPFYSTKKNGSGIGLSLSKQIISAHGGSIKAKSTPDSGTTFIISLRNFPGERRAGINI